MRRFKLVILTILISILISIPIVTAADDEKVKSPNDSMIPSISELYNNKDNKYFSSYKNNYYLDLKETGMFKSWDGKIFNTLANLIFGLQVTLAQLVIAIVYYSFEISFFDIFNEPLSIILKNLQEGIFNELFSVCVATIGIFYIVKMVKNQRTKVITAVFQTILVIVLALTFLRVPGDILKGVDNVSKDIGQLALEGTYKATNDGKDSKSATEALSTNLWVMFVHRPWQIFEFFDTQVAEKHEDKLLTLSPESEERQKVVNDIAKDKKHLQPSAGIGRLGASLLYFVIFIVIAIGILLLCAMMVGYQFLMILIAMFAPLVFLLALIPRFGIGTVKSWFGKILSFGSMKAIMSLVTAIVFSFMLATFKLIDKYGLLIVALIQVVCLMIIWIKRNELLDGYFRFVAAARHPTPSNINRALNRDDGLENGFRRSYSRGASDSNKKNSNSGGNKNSGANSLGKKTNKNNPNGSNNSNQTKSKGNNGSKDKSKENNVDYSKEFNSANNNLNSLLRIAEEILEKKYEESKLEAEEKAELLGKHPEYTNWTKQVMEREKMNLNKFEEREKMAVVNQLKQIQDNGGNLEDINLIDEDKQKAQIRPKKVESVPVKFNLEEVPETINDTEASKKFVEEFNTHFDKNYNDKFMKNLINQFGQDNVKGVLDDMYRIDKKESIKNPPAYLIESLRNNNRNTNEYKSDIARTEKNGIELDLRKIEVDKFDGAKKEKE